MGGCYGSDGVCHYAVTDNGVFSLPFFSHSVGVNTSDFSATVYNNEQFILTIKKAGTYQITKYFIGGTETTETQTFSANATYTVPARTYHTDYVTIIKIS